MTWPHLLASCTTAIMAACTLVATAVTSSAGAQHVDGLQDLAQRLRDGDRSAIAELLERTRPAAQDLDLDASHARLEALRTEIARLNARRGARPVFPVTAAEPEPRPTTGREVGEARRADALREARAWLRAGQPDLALRALPAATGADKDLTLHLEARALEGLGRSAEALDVYRELASSAESPTLRMRAQGDVAHLEWRAKRAGAREGRP